MFRSLFAVLISASLGTSGLVLKRRFLFPNSIYHSLKDKKMIGERDKSHWTFLSSRLVLGEEGEFEEEAEFFGIKKIVRDSKDPKKIKIEDSEGVVENAEKLRKKCHEYLNRRKTSVVGKNPLPREMIFINKWCFFDSPEFPENFSQFKGFFEWEYEKDKRIFITDKTVPQSSLNLNPSSELNIEGYFLVNLIPLIPEFKKMKPSDDRSKNLFRNFPQLFTVDFYGCLIDEKELKKNKFRYWIGYTDNEVSRNDFPSASKRVPQLDSSANYCGSVNIINQKNQKFNKLWVTYSYKMDKPVAQHYKISKNTREIRNFINEIS